jgi:uncharacterized protein YndB with AHSA1/START domain
MSGKQYSPGAANATVEKGGERWSLILVRELDHSPENVWRALTDPDELREWAPFDADTTLSAGKNIRLSTVGAPSPHVTETTVTRADEPQLLEFKWGESNIRWQLEPNGQGTRLTLWTDIDKRYVAMGAAGWHICIDVMDHMLDGDAVGRIVGPEAMKFEGWQRLHADYNRLFAAS